MGITEKISHAAECKAFESSLRWRRCKIFGVYFLRSGRCPHRPVKGETAPTLVLEDERRQHKKRW